MLRPSHSVLMLCNDLLDHQQVLNHFNHKHFGEKRVQECGYDRQVGLIFKSGLALCSASSKMSPSSVPSGKRLFATNKHKSCLLPPWPGTPGRRVQIPCEKLANFAKLLLDSPGCSLRSVSMFPGTRHG